MRALSNSKSSVSWRLNGLLRARKKAKAFAATSWENPEDGSQPSGFTKWQPQVLGEDGEAWILADQPLVSEEESAVGEDSLQQTPEQQLAEQQRQEQEITEAAHQQAIQQAYDQGYQRGTDESEAKLADAKNSFDELVQSIGSAQKDMTSFYNPLKKLALHLAEQLVRGELAQSSVVIERLVREALKDVERQGEAPIVLSLNPEDKNRFSANLEGELDSLELRADPQLSAGSVKVTIDDSAIEDLIEHRLDSLSQELLGQPMAGTRRAFDNSFPNQVDEKPLEGAVELGPEADSPAVSDESLQSIAQEVDLDPVDTPLDADPLVEGENQQPPAAEIDADLTEDAATDVLDQPPSDDQESETDD